MNPWIGSPTSDQSATTVYPVTPNSSARGQVRQPKLTPWTAHYLGALTTVLGRFEDAEAHLTHALTAHEATPAPFFTARTHLEWAKLLLARHGPSDREHADEHLHTAIELARNYGCALVEQRASALLDHQ